MNERDHLDLAHGAAAIDAARSFTTEGRDAFMVDLKTQSAVIRQIEMIGEAVKRLSEEAKAREPGVPWRLIAGTRDRLIHGCFQVGLAAVWSMVEHDLGPSRAAILRLQAG